MNGLALVTPACRPSQKFSHVGRVPPLIFSCFSPSLLSLSCFIPPLTRIYFRLALVCVVSPLPYCSILLHHRSLFLQREGAEDILDFWLDVQQHENLCRAYFKDVRKSGRTIREDWPEYWEYARRRGSTYGTVVGGQPGAKRSTASTTEMAAEMLPLPRTVAQSPCALDAEVAC